MSTSGRQAPVQAGSIIGGRYEVCSLLGQGGMGAVYEVVERATGERLALKRMGSTPEDPKYKRNLALFEREYHTLSQLAHPRVIQVYDYGFDTEGPYYTMELLDGVDLHTAGTLHWREVCSLLRDIASSLSLLHARRLIHRDVTPKNIRRTSDGRAKLLDFGAMMQMGPCSTIVGTPPFVAPEVLDRQTLDAGVDLFALGATFYRLLTGRHAYPARDFDRLLVSHKRLPLAASAYAPDVPKELDALVLQLLSQERLARVRSAAEVIHRLTAIAQLPAEDQTTVSEAYLATPALVGRGSLIERARQKLERAKSGRGSVLLVEGEPGSGRSRALDACGLEARLAGAVILRAQAGQHAWDAARSVVGQLLAARPDERGSLPARLAALLHSESGEVERQQRAALQAELRAWLGGVCQRHLLAILADDAERIDEPSVALLAGLAQSATDHRLFVVVSSRRANSEQRVAPMPDRPALALLRKAAVVHRLAPLAPEDTALLVGSLFSDAPHSGLVAARLHRASGGNPRACMELAQHLVDTGIVRYEGGSWLLPERLQGVLPESTHAAMATRLQRLPADARTLAQALSLCPQVAFGLDEQLRLMAREDKRVLYAALSVLAQTGIVDAYDTGHSVSRHEWVEVLRESLDAPVASRLHRRLAQVFAERCNGYYESIHLFEAGDLETATQRMVATAERLIKREEAEELQANMTELFQTAEYVRTREAALAALGERGGSARERFLLQLALVHAQVDHCEIYRRHLPQVLRRLTFDSGLDDYLALESEALPQEERLMRALGQAQARFDGSPESARVLAPGDAVSVLARLNIAMAGNAAVMYDYDLIESLPSLEPLVALSPALGVAQQVVRAAGHLIAGRYRDALGAYRAALEGLAQPERAGLDPTLHRMFRHAMLYAVAAVEASRGKRVALDVVRELDDDPAFTVNAQYVRMTYHLTLGQAQLAQEHRARAELLQIENAPTQLFDSGVVFSQLLGAAQANDVLGVRQQLGRVAAFAEQFPTWEAVLHYARGQCARLLGDHGAACQHFADALARTRPGRHHIWPLACAGQVEALTAVGRATEAVQLGNEALQASQAKGLDCVVAAPLALAEVVLGQTDRAVEHANEWIAANESQGVNGVRLGAAYETRARIALQLGDEQGFDRFAASCAAQYNVGKNETLTARYEKLRQEARQAELDALASIRPHPEHADRTHVTELLTHCAGREDRADVVLSVLLESAGASQGALYLLDRGELSLAAKSMVSPPSELDSLLRQYLELELERERTATTMAATVVEKSPGPTHLCVAGVEYVPTLIQHLDEGHMTVTGVAAVVRGPDEKRDLPWHVIDAMSRTLVQYGDVPTPIVAG